MKTDLHLCADTSTRLRGQPTYDGNNGVTAFAWCNCLICLSMIIQRCTHKSTKNADNESRIGCRETFCSWHYICGIVRHPKETNLTNAMEISATAFFNLMQATQRYIRVVLQVADWEGTCQKYIAQLAKATWRVSRTKSITQISHEQRDLFKANSRTWSRLITQYDAMCKKYISSLSCGTECALTSLLSWEWQQKNLYSCSPQPSLRCNSIAVPTKGEILTCIRELDMGFFKTGHSEYEDSK